LIELFDDPNWKTEVFIKGVGRIVDYRNYDFIKLKAKFPQTI